MIPFLVKHTSSLLWKRLTKNNHFSVIGEIISVEVKLRIPVFIVSSITEMTPCLNKTGKTMKVMIAFARKLNLKRSLGEEVFPRGSKWQWQRHW